MKELTEKTLQELTSTEMETLRTSHPERYTELVSAIDAEPRPQSGLFAMRNGSPIAVEGTPGLAFRNGFAVAPETIKAPDAAS